MTTERPQGSHYRPHFSSIEKESPDADRPEERPTLSISPFTLDSAPLKPSQDKPSLPDSTKFKFDGQSPKTFKIALSQLEESKDEAPAAGPTPHIQPTLQSQISFGPSAANPDRKWGTPPRKQKLGEGSPDGTLKLRLSNSPSQLCTSSPREDKAICALVTPKSIRNTPSPHGEDTDVAVVAGKPHKVSQFKIQPHHGSHAHFTDSSNHPPALGPASGARRCFGGGEPEDFGQVMRPVYQSSFAPQQPSYTHGSSEDFQLRPVCYAAPPTQQHYPPPYQTHMHMCPYAPGNFYGGTPQPFVCFPHPPGFKCSLPPHMCQPRFVHAPPCHSCRQRMMMRAAPQQQQVPGQES